MGKLNNSEINVVEENLAELQRAVQVIEAGDVDGVVAIGVRKGHKPKGLPEIDLDKVEADTYYRTTDGVIHLNEVKNTPNAFVSKLLETFEEGQFRRYRNWMKKGTENGQVRQVMVYVRNSEPNFHRIIDEETLTALEESIAAQNKTKTILQIKDTKFSFNELQKLYQQAYKKAGELIKLEKKLNPKLNNREVTKLVLKKYFGSIETTFKTLGENYGH